MVTRILIVEDDKAVRFGVARYLAQSGFVVDEASNCEMARERFRAFAPDAVVTDFRLPDGEALELISAFRRERPDLPIVVLTGYGSIELAVRAVKTGADNLLTKPVDMAKLVEELHRVARVSSSARGSGTFRALSPVAQSRAMAVLEEEVARLKDVDCSLLILGETGTGKTVLARRIHEASRRRGGTFVDLNCAGLARELVESELFGHERGAFTSAHASKAGMLELADGGTLFLDEIGDIDASVQPKLLKAIEEKRFRRLGSAREQTVDARVIAATHRDLRRASTQFRADLYYRISTVTITLPSLRERREDIPLLARDLVASLASRIGRAAPELADDALAAFASHSWPGNIRELRNVLERALHFSHADVLTARDVRIEEPAPGDVVPQSTVLRKVEQAHIERALAIHGHVGEAARSLGISRSSMYLKLKAYGVLPGRGGAHRAKAGGDPS